LFKADILDDRYVEVRQSQEYPEAGEGLVAKVDIPEWTVVSLMSGLIFTKAQNKKHQLGPIL
jgi:hypothetical protein